MPILAPALTLAKSHTGNFQLGGQGTYTLQAGNSGGVGYLSSRYSRMIVESNTTVSPSTSAGTSPRGLTVPSTPLAGPPPNPSGAITSKAIFFSRRAILTFCT